MRNLPEHCETAHGRHEECCWNLGFCTVYDVHHGRSRTSSSFGQDLQHTPVLLFEMAVIVIRIGTLKFKAMVLSWKKNGSCLSGGQSAFGKGL